MSKLDLFFQGVLYPDINQIYRKLSFNSPEYGHIFSFTHKPKELKENSEILYIKETFFKNHREPRKSNSETKPAIKTVRNIFIRPDLYYTLFLKSAQIKIAGLWCVPTNALPNVARNENQSPQPCIRGSLAFPLDRVSSEPAAYNVYHRMLTNFVSMLSR